MLKPLIKAELKVGNSLLGFEHGDEIFLVLVEILARTDVGGCWVDDHLSYSWHRLDFGIPYLVVLSCKQHEVVGGASLEFFVGQGVLVVSIVLSDARVVFADHDIQSLIGFWLEHGALFACVHYFYAVCNVVGSCAWDFVIDWSKPFFVEDERSSVTTLLWQRVKWHWLICLRSWSFFYFIQLFSSRCFKIVCAFDALFWLELFDQVLG